MEAKPPDGDGERPKVRATFASLANRLATPKAGNRSDGRVLVGSLGEKQQGLSI
jgi:hypothetical protein